MHLLLGDTMMKTQHSQGTSTMPQRLVVAVVDADVKKFVIIAVQGNDAIHEVHEAGVDADDHLWIIDSLLEYVEVPHGIYVWEGTYTFPEGDTDDDDELVLPTAAGSWRAPTPEELQSVALGIYTRV
jgi:hypothetical protein